MAFPLPNARRRNGFTLVELITVMAIVAILLTIGVPSFRYVTNTNRIAGEVNGLVGDLEFARAEATKEGQQVTVCVAANVTPGNYACAANDNAWHHGWIVFLDLNNDQTIDNVNDTVFRVQQPFTTLGSSDTFVAGNALSAVPFNRVGYAVGLANGTLVTLHAATPSTASTRCVSISTVGQMTVFRSGAGGCV